MGQSEEPKGEERYVEHWETVDSEKIADCHVFSLYRHHRRLPGSEAVGEFHTLRAPDWVNVLALTEDNKMVMIYQYRHGTEEVTLEIPGGMVDAGERPEEAGRRELLEETGFEADEISLIGMVHPNPAYFDNKQYTVLARGVRQVASQSLDTHEDIHVAVYSLEEVSNMVREGKITHGLVINALFWYREREIEERGG